MFDFLMQQVLGMKWLSELVWQLHADFGGSWIGSWSQGGQMDALFPE